MKHLQTFEAFLIPKRIRKYMWKDEDIALQVLKELESLKGNHQAIQNLKITPVQGPEWMNDYIYKFNLDDFEFKVEWSFRLRPGGGTDDGYLEMNGNMLDISDEVCRKIKNTIVYLMNTDDREVKDFDKKDFRLSRKLKA